MFEEDLRARLTGDAAIAAKARAKSIAWGDRPQASGLPAITLDDAGGNRDQHMEGFQGLQERRVQIDVWSKDKLEARDIRELVIAAVVPVATIGATRFSRGFLNGEPAPSFERTDAGDVIYRERIDFSVWHSAA